jgi:hypothetical protein
MTIQIKDTFLNAVESSQHCQRNWDYSKTLDDDIIEWLWNVGITTPTKENVNTFEINVIKDRELINKFSSLASNPNYKDEEYYSHDRIQNPQTTAHVLFLFWIKHEVTIAENSLENRDDKIRMNIYEWHNTVMTEIGISASAIAVGANLIGLKTGFCRCIDHLKVLDDLKIKLGRHINDNLMLMLGVGYPLTDRSHNYYNNLKYNVASYPKVKKTLKIF